MRETLRAFRVIVGGALRVDPVRTILSVVMQLACQLAPPLFALLLRSIVDGVAKHDDSRAMGAAVALSVTMAALWLGRGTGMRLRLSVGDRVGHFLDRQLLRAVLGRPYLDHHESPQYRDRLERLLHGGNPAEWGIIVGFWALAWVVQAVMICFLLARLHPALLLLPVFGLPLVLASSVQSSRLVTAQEAAAPDLRRAEHAFSVLSEPSGAAEARVWGIASWLVDLHRVHKRQGAKIVQDVHLRMLRVTALARLLFGMAVSAAVLFVVWRVTAGQASPGDMVLALAVVMQVDANVTMTASLGSLTLQAIAEMRRHLWVLDFDRDPHPTGAAPAPATLHDGIRLEGISFNYPGIEATALNEVDLFLPAGTTVALVGENGAGKSTIIKLLCRMYQPSAGRILVDGQDLQEIALDDWRQTVSGAFQDFVRFELLTQEAIGIGDVQDIGDAQLVSAAADRAGAGSLVRSLPDGLNTQLGRSWDGVELSGGQWQKLALG